MNHPLQPLVNAITSDTNISKAFRIGFAQSAAEQRLSAPAPSLREIIADLRRIEKHLERTLMETRELLRELERE